MGRRQLESDVTYMGGSVALLATDRNAWHARADSAWGSSRVWNSGSSFETDSATWHGRADQAWGSSRAWSSGESWEAAYTRVLPPASAIHLAANGNCNADGVYHNPVATLTLDRTGYWTLVWRAGQGATGMDGYVGGALTVQSSGTPTAGTLGAVDGPTLRNVGTQVTIAINASGGGFRTGYIDAYFQPTQANPH